MGFNLECALPPVDLPVLALLVVLQVVLDHVDHDLVADESTVIHDLLGLHTDLGLVGNGSAEHVTSSQMADAVLLLDAGGLGALAYVTITQSRNSRFNSLYLVIKINVNFLVFVGERHRKKKFPI